MDLFNFQHIKAIILTIADKDFPDNWEDLNFIIIKNFELNFELILNENIIKSLNYLLKINDIIYSVIKQHNKKKLPSTRSKFLKIKNSFINNSYNYYQNLHMVFNTKILGLNNIEIISLFFKLIQSADQLILIIVESSFSLNDFQRDEKLLLILKMTLEKLNFLNEKLFDANDHKIKSLIKRSIYKLIKSLTKIQSSASIIFYKDLEYYMNILGKILDSFTLYDKDILKITFFAIYKIINTTSYKELIPEIYGNIRDKDQFNEISISKFDSNGNINSNFSGGNLSNKTSLLNSDSKVNSRPLNNFNLTPEKKFKNINSKSGVNILVSPTKFKNYENELNEVNKIFYNCFSNENIKDLIDKLIQKIPFSDFNKNNETENFENNSDNNNNLNYNYINEIEDDFFSSESYSSNIMTWNILYKNLLQSILTNFPEISMRYIKDSINFFTQKTNFNNTNKQNLLNNINNTNNLETNNLEFFDEKNILILQSVIYFINIVPSEYKKGVILEYNMLDYRIFFDLMEKLLFKSDLILRDYILSISKWSEILISEEIFFKYIDNLYMFLITNMNYDILLEACFSLKNLINQIDKLLKGNNELNVFVEKKKLEENIKEKINWSKILEAVCNVTMKLIPYIKSAEILLSLINLFTILVNKCHYQLDGKILQTIKDSKLIEIINNMEDDFSQNAFCEMWKTLILAYPDSEIIVELSLFFLSKCIKVILNSKKLKIFLI